MFRIASLLLILISASPAAVFYIDRTGGSDSADGRGRESAWQSLARLRSASVSAGDYVLLKRGETWQEQLPITSSGEPDVPVTYGVYGEGDAPVLDGTEFVLRSNEGLVDLQNKSNVIISGLTIRNSRRHGVNLSGCRNVTLRGLTISGGRGNGVLAFNCIGVTVESAVIFGNSLDLSASYDGIRIDSNRDVRDFLIRDSTIHSNLGGAEWRSANGIFVGHTGANVPTIQSVRIIGNTLYGNGNPGQNQAGRGVTGTFHGDVVVSGNFIYQNASAGLYLGDEGTVLDILISRNVFYNNSLRQFGGYTDANAVANGNLIVVDDPNITAMGAEIGGMGTWELTRNTFWYATGTNDRFRSFIKINNVEMESRLTSDLNLYYSQGPRRWRRADDVIMDFSQWQAAGFDHGSSNPR